MTKGCAYDVNEWCVELEAGNWNVRWAGVSVRWKRECSLLDTWEFVAGYVRVRERKWAESVSGTEQNRWAELMRERKWRVVRKREVDSYDVVWCRTWRAVRLNVADSVVERKNVMTRWLQTWITELCFTVVDSIVCECDVLLLWSDWREKNRYAVKLWKLQR